MAHVIQVSVVDDDEILLHGFAHWLIEDSFRPDDAQDRPVDARGEVPTFDVVATAPTVLALLEHDGRASGAWEKPPPTMTGRLEAMPHPAAGVAVLDLRLRDGERVADNVRRLRVAGYAVVACSTIDDGALVHEAMRSGALSYVRKSRDSTEMRTALTAAGTGERYTSRSHAALIERGRGYGVPELSGQEREALRLYASGLTMASVARRLNVKQGTAKSYLDRVRDKYDQAGRAARTKLELRDRAVEDGVHTPSRPVD
jgi:two-component system nitrate/nitrite response regulator NarL